MLFFFFFQSEFFGESWSFFFFFFSSPLPEQPFLPPRRDAKGRRTLGLLRSALFLPLFFHGQRTNVKRGERKLHLRPLSFSYFPTFRGKEATDRPFLPPVASAWVPPHQITVKGGGKRTSTCPTFFFFRLSSLTPFLPDFGSWETKLVVTPFFFFLSPVAHRPPSPFHKKERLARAVPFFSPSPLGGPSCLLCRCKAMSTLVLFFSLLSLLPHFFWIFQVRRKVVFFSFFPFFFRMPPPPRFPPPPLLLDLGSYTRTWVEKCLFFSRL